MDVEWTTVFADGPTGGNPCPVVFGADACSPAELLAQAADFGVETVFVLPATGGDVRLRYFVPRHEMEMCVHATVAATVLLGRAGRLARNPAVVETLLGPIEVTWSADHAVVEQFAPRFGPPVEPSVVLAALGISAEQLGDGPIRSVSTARAKLIIALRDETVLDGLRPDFELLWAACDDLDVTGFYPFARLGADGDIAARQFPRRTGYVEDPATGVAAAALGAHLSVGRPAGWHSWRVAQGRAMGRPSMIVAEALTDDTGAVSATRVGGAMRTSDPVRL